LYRQFKRKDGAVLELEVTTKMLGDGKVLAFGRDITERKNTENKIRESELKYRTLMQQAGDSILLFTGSGQLIEANHSAKVLLGYSNEEYQKMSLRDLFFEEDIKQSPLRFDLLNRGESTINRRRLKRKDGVALETEIHAKKLSDGNYLGVARDLTERLQAEYLIKKQKEQYDDLVTNIPVGVYKFRMKGDGSMSLDYISPRLCNMIGVKEEDAYRDVKNTFKIIHPDDFGRFIKLIEESYTTRQNFLWEGRSIVNDKVNWVKVESFPMVLKNGDILWDGVIADITQNKKAELSLKESEEKYRSLIEQASDGIVLADKQGNFIDVNPSICKLLGYTREELLNQNISTVMDAEQLKKDPLRFDLLLQGHNVLRERILLHKDGSSVEVEVNVKMIPDGTIMSVFRDTRERKKAQEEILKTNARFQMLSKATSDIVWDWDMLQDTLWWNDNYYSQLGLKKEKELTDLDDWYSRIHPDDVPRVKKDLEAANKDNSVYRSHEYRYKKADGTYLNFLDRSFVMRNPEGKPYRMVGSMINMTPVYLAQKEIAESENRLRTIFETEPECIKLLGPKGELLDMNPAGLAMIEADSLDMVKGTLISNVVMPEHRDAFNRLNRDVFKGEPGKLKFEIVGLKGTHRWMETHAVPLKNADGKIISILGVSRDITESKKAEQALIEREEQYRALVENAPEALVVFDVEKRKFVSVSESAVSLFKYSRDEFLRIGPQDISPEYQPDGRLTADAIMDNISQAIAGGKPFFEWTHCDKDGNPIPCEVRLVRLPSENKILIRGSMIDITERKRAQEELLESERFLNKSQAVSKIGSYVLNFKTGKWRSSAELDNILEFTSDDNHTIDGWASVLHPDHKKMMMEYFTEEVIGKKKRFDKEYKIIKKKSGKECWVHGIGDLEFDSSGTLVRMLGVIQDITERKETDVLLKESEERYRTLVEQAVDAIAQYDAAGKVLDVNTGCANLLGYTKEELVGMSLNEILTKEEIKSNPVRYDVLQQGVSTVKQRRMIRKDGTIVETEVRSQQLPDGRFLSVIRDLSDRLRVEKDLAASYDAIRKLTGHLQDIREDERAHIAREIHDELGQQLTVMKMDVSCLKKRIKGSDESLK